MQKKFPVENEPSLKLTFPVRKCHCSWNFLKICYQQNIFKIQSYFAIMPWIKMKLVLKYELKTGMDVLKQRSRNNHSTTYSLSIWISVLESTLCEKCGTLRLNMNFRWIYPFLSVKMCTADQTFYYLYPDFQNIWNFY